MNFEERNADWNGSLREFRQMHTRKGKPRVWAIRVEGSQVITVAGELGGAQQQFAERMQGINIGKKNEKTPEQYAVERARYYAEKKYREGYREVALMLNGTPAMKADDTPVFLDLVTEKVVDFENLPGSLSFYKPENTMSAGLEKKALAGGVFYSRKRNGLAFIISKGEAGAKLYSRTMLRQNDNETDTELTWDDRFSAIRDAATLVMPPNSVMLGELVVDRDGQDDMPQVQSLIKSLTPVSIEKQQEGKPSFYIWDIAFWDGVDLVSKAPVKDRYELIHEIDFSGLSNTLIPVQYFDSSLFKSPDEATEYAKKKGWEGFVVVDPDGIYGDKAYNFKGKPDRPGQACGKLKPTYEDDFVAFWDPGTKIANLHKDVIVYPSAKNATVGERSTKERNGQGIKAVALFQYNKHGQLVYISNVSSGLTDEAKRDWADPALYPQVWKVKYKDRRYVSQGEDTNAMDFAAFEEVRSDKKTEECVNPEL